MSLHKEIVVMPEQDALKAINAAERHRTAVESLAMPHSGNSPGVVTISGGVTAFRGPADERPSDVLRRADAALYEAKEGGRNRVVAAE